MNNKDRDKRISKFLSLVLRHSPETIGITLDDAGYVQVKELIEKTNSSGRALTLELLERIVVENDKKRFAFSDDKKKIRANQGHSINVDLKLDKVIPPDVLYHGTPSTSKKIILQQGIKKMKRHHVHLSKDIKTANIVGSRRGNHIVFTIDAKKMHSDGYEFFVSDNDVYLTDFVESIYIIGTVK